MVRKKRGEGIAIEPSSLELRRCGRELVRRRGEERGRGRRRVA
jgi:hypothetical protein